jgi:hypothetical protein
MQSLEKDFYLGALGSFDDVFTPFVQMWLWGLDNEPHTKLSLFIFMLWEFAQACIPHCDYLSFKTLTIGLVNNIYNITCVYIGFKIGIFGLANNVTKFSKVQPINYISSTCTKP